MKCNVVISLIVFFLIGGCRLFAQTPQADSRVGHAETVNAIAISPDGKTFATGSADGTIIIWDVGSGKLLRTIDGKLPEKLDGLKELARESEAEDEISFTALAYSPNGLTLAAATGDKVILFDLKSGKELATLRDAQDDPIRSLEFSPDGKIIAIASKPYTEVEEETLALWDVTQRKKIRSLAGATAPIAFDLSGKFLATSGKSHWVQIWNVASGKRTVALEPLKEFADIQMFSFNKGGTILAALTTVFDDLEYKVLFVNPTNGKPIKTNATTKASGVARFSADGINFIQNHDQNGLEVVNPTTGKRVAAIENATVCCSSSAHSRNGSILASLNGKTVNFANLVSKKGSEAKIGYTTNVGSAAFTPDSRKIVAGYDDGRIIRWDLSTGKIDRIVSPMFEGKPDDISFIGAPLVSSDSMRFMPSSGSFAIFDSSTGNRTVSGENRMAIDSHYITPDGKHAITITKETVTVRDALTGKLVDRFVLKVGNENPDEIRVASSPDNSVIALATEKQVSFWDPKTGSKIKELPEDEDSAGETFGFSPDGQFFVIGGASDNKQINVIRYMSQKEVLLLEDSFPYFAISPDSKTIASINSEKNLVLTSLVDPEVDPIIGDEAIRISEIEGTIDLVYSPDGKKIAVYGPYGVTIFDAKTAVQLRQLK